MFFEMFGYVYIVFGVALPIFIAFFIRAMENENIKKRLKKRNYSFAFYNIIKKKASSPLYRLQKKGKPL